MSRPTTRIAPSPTGALHLGNARTFLVNWAMARQSGWKIVYRIEDLDTPRVKPGAIGQTTEILTWLGIDWDEQAPLQSENTKPYQQAMEMLAEQSMVYPCTLSRKEIAEAAGAPHAGEHEPRFDPILRPAEIPRSFTEAATNWRFITPETTVSFDDRFAGPISRNPAHTVGDFIVWTQRSQPAYQLAVVIDDHRQGITEVVRGDDLIDSAARQLLLYRALNLAPEPTYTHLPLVRGTDGRRLAKRHGDTRLAHYKDRGVPPERIIALLARWSGIRNAGDFLTAKDFANRFRLDTMPRGDLTFTPEDDQWLIEGGSR